ncbi:MAG: ribosome biogenesis GTPase Der [Puniceicoccales bacterium]|nr:ribosome biogenesis GTPase Der [Puniceicoccales bacterium]
MPVSSEIPRCVAIVGRPNVGKSRLFNRLVGKRISIVHDSPGVTRDLITEHVTDGDYLLMDTGGIGLFTTLTPKVIAEAVEEQVGFAINAAGVVLLVVDVNEGCVPLDLEIAAKLRRFGKKVLLVANKADNAARAANQADFFSLNLNDPILVSAEHGTGVPFLIEKIKTALGAESAAVATLPDAQPETERTRICLLGRPNVGKSSIGNKLLNSPRLIVSEVAGTTREPVRVLLDHTNADGSVWHFELVDTAGRRAAMRQDSLDFYSTLRSDALLAATDVVLLVIDALIGVTRIDKQLAGKILEVGAGLVVVVNKWDLALQRFSKKDEGIDGYENEPAFRREYSEVLRRELFFLPDSPVIFTSAHSGLNIEELLVTARAVYKCQRKEIPTARLNKVLQTLMERQPPRMVSGRRLKCYYAVQVSFKPLLIRMFCNSKERVESAYERYLAAGLRTALDVRGVPLALEFVGKPKDPERQFFLEQQLPTTNAHARTPSKKAKPTNTKSGPRERRSKGAPLKKTRPPKR